MVMHVESLKWAEGLRTSNASYTQAQEFRKITGRSGIWVVINFSSLKIDEFIWTSITGPRHEEQRP